MNKSSLPDPFEKARHEKGYGKMNDQNDGEEVGRIVVPSEVAIRDTRQIPFEVDPPEHKGYRNLVEPWFKRPLEDDYKAQLEKIVSDCIDEVIAEENFEVVSDFSLKLQSRALTVLLNIPYEESEVWINWKRL